MRVAVKLLMIMVGVIVAVAVCFVIFSLISEYQLAQTGYKKAQSDQLIDIFLVVTPFFMGVGGWLALRWYKKYQTEN